MTAVLLIGDGVVATCTETLAGRGSESGVDRFYGFMANIPPSLTPPTGFLGVITFDGAGNVTGTETIVSPDLSPGATTVSVQTSPFTGTYTLNGDGTGILSLNFGGDTPTQVAFVTTDGGAGLMFVQTGSRNFLLMGTARKQ